MTVTQLRQANMSEDDLRNLCERRVRRKVGAKQLRDAGLSRLQLIIEIEGVVQRNLDSGRAAWVMQRDRSKRTLPSKQLQDYVDKVIPIYLQEHRRVKSLAADDEKAWAALYNELTYRARNMLRARSNSQEPVDFAQWACMSIYHNHWFPYDVSFDAWASTILRNHINWPPTRSPDLLDRHPNIGSIDQIGQQEDQRTLHDLLADQSINNDFDSIENRQWLMDAIEQLPSKDQQDVICLKYFEEMSDEDIARKLGKTRQAVYSLRHRALLKLKQILKTQ